MSKATVNFDERTVTITNRKGEVLGEFGEPTVGHRNTVTFYFEDYKEEPKYVAKEAEAAEKKAEKKKAKAAEKGVNDGA